MADRVVPDPADPPSWPTGAGDMAERVRRHDWTATPLGPVAQWPQALRCAVDLILGSPLGMIILWGPDLVQIYNDGYRALMAGKHPGGLGQPTRECWPEVWEFTAPIYRAVMRGESRSFSDHELVLERHGVPESIWFDLTYGPIREENGLVGGILATVVETTGKVLAERRQNFLLRLEARLRRLRDPRALLDAAGDEIARQVGAAQVAYADIESSGRIAVVERDWNDGRMPSIAGRHRLEAIGRGFADALRRGRTVAIGDVREDVRTAQPATRRALDRAAVRALVHVPLVKAGRLAAVLAIHCPQPRDWATSDVAVVEDAAARTWDALERARSEQRLRHSEERLRLALDVGRLGTWDWDIQGGRLTWSEEHFRMLGHRPGAFEPSYGEWLARLHPGDRDDVLAALAAARCGQGDYVCEYRAILADGSVRWHSARGRFFHDGTGRPVRMIGVMEDTTERRQAAETQQVLVAELQHRTRNLLAVVQALASQTLARSDTLGRTFGTLHTTGSPPCHASRGLAVAVGERAYLHRRASCDGGRAPWGAEPMRERIRDSPVPRCTLRYVHRADPWHLALHECDHERP